MMSDERLLTYLNDHLAGAVTALEMMDYRIEQGAQGPTTAFLRGLRPEIERDREVLEAVIQSAHGQKSLWKRAAAWLTEKVTRVKRRTRGGSAHFGAFEELEALALGILGKRALWRLLDVLYRDDPRFAAFDFVDLARRAQQQHDRVEVARLEEGQRAFSTQG